jgi:hypothetical protein
MEEALAIVKRRIGNFIAGADSNIKAVIKEEPKWEKWETYRLKQNTVPFSLH